MKRTILFLIFVLAEMHLCLAQVDTVSKYLNDTLKVESLKDTAKNIHSPQVVSDTSNYALLFVYRPKNFVGSIMSYNLKLNNSVIKDSIICNVKNNSKYMIKIFQEGKTELWAQTEQKKSVFINMKFGQKYYLKCGITMGVMVGRPELNLVYPEQGEMDYENVEGRKVKNKKK